MAFKKLVNLMAKPFDHGQKSRESGMSIIEILIVIALMGTVMALLVSNLTDSQDSAMEDAARLGMTQLETNLQMYKVHNFRYPTTEQGLGALVTKPSGAKRWRGPYTVENKLQDPWGNDLDY